MDLAKRDTPLRSRPQTTFRRETTMPRQATDLPGLEVNAPITRADTSGADQLSRILGLATDVSQKIAGDIQQNKNNEDAAQALLDYGTGHQDEKRYAKSRANRDAWQLQGAKQTAITISEDATQRVNTLLNGDTPPTLEDVDAAIEQSLHDHLFDEHGKPLDFITPQAKMTLGSALAKLKAELMPKAAQAITKRQNERLFGTTFQNQIFERDAGAEIGGGPLPMTTAVAPASTDGIDTTQSPNRSKPIPKGWKGNQEDAIQELGMTADEAAQFLKTGKDPRKATATAAPQLDRADLKARIAMAESGGNGSSNNPLSSASGLYGITDGTFTSFGGNLAKKNNPAEQGRVMDKLLANNEAALTKAGFKLTAGNIYLAHFLGSAGAVNALKNPEAAVSAKVQKANPFTKGWTNADVISWAKRKMGEKSGVVIADGSEPTLKTAPDAPDQLRPGFDVERFMASLPPSVNKGEAKVWLINTLFAKVADSGDTSLLNGLEDATRKDGTPSFTPEERLKIVETRDRLREKNRVEADRVEKKMQEDNAGMVLQAFAEGNPPSSSWLTEQSSKGLLDERFVYTMVDHIEAQAKSDAREARMETRQAQAEADAEHDTEVYSEESALRAGIGLGNASYAKLTERMRAGEFGEGKKAAARVLRLQAAAKIGQKALEENPEFAYYSGQLADNFKPVRDTGRLMILKPQSNVSKATYQAMVSYYEEKVHSGEKPGDAYREAVQKYGKAPSTPKDQLASIREQIAELRRKRSGQ